MANNAGLFDDSAMTDMSPRNLPPMQGAGPADITSPGGSTDAGVTPPPAPVAPTSIQGSDTGPDNYFENVPVTPRDMTPEQSQAWFAFVNATRRYNLSNGRMDRFRQNADQAEVQRLTERLNALGIDLEYGQPVRRQARNAADIDQAQFNFNATPGGTAANNSGRPVEQVGALDDTSLGITNGRSPTTAAGLTIGAPASTDLSSVFDGINDTSRPLQPTREMRLADAAMRNDLERAQLYAAHGRPELAAEAFGRALQQRADYITQERTVMYRAAANGSLRAAERLIEEYNGYGRGEVRLRQAGNQFNIEIQDENGRWIMANQTPISRDGLLSSLQNLVDAEGAAARSEANQEYLMNVMDNQTELAIAGIVAETAHSRMFTDIQLERMGNEAALAVAEGRAQIVQNEESGETLLFYPRTVNGETYQEMERIVTGRQRSPDTNSNREVDVTTRTRVTGINNVGAN
jgi:type II secretory pathway component PulJ